MVKMLVVTGTMSNTIEGSLKTLSTELASLEASFRELKNSVRTSMERAQVPSLNPVPKDLHAQYGTPAPSQASSVVSASRSESAKSELSTIDQMNLAALAHRISKSKK